MPLEFEFDSPISRSWPSASISTDMIPFNPTGFTTSQGYQSFVVAVLDLGIQVIDHMGNLASSWIIPRAFTYISAPVVVDSSSCGRCVIIGLKTIEGKSGLYSWKYEETFEWATCVSIDEYQSDFDLFVASESCIVQFKCGSGFSCSSDLSNIVKYDFGHAVSSTAVNVAEDGQKWIACVGSAGKLSVVSKAYLNSNGIMCDLTCRKLAMSVRKSRMYISPSAEILVASVSKAGELMYRRINADNPSWVILDRTTDHSQATVMILNDGHIISFDKGRLLAYELRFNSLSVDVCNEITKNGNLVSASIIHSSFFMIRMKSELRAIPMQVTRSKLSQCLKASLKCASKRSEVAPVFEVVDKPTLNIAKRYKIAMVGYKDLSDRKATHELKLKMQTKGSDILETVVSLTKSGKMTSAMIESTNLLAFITAEAHYYLAFLLLTEVPNLSERILMKLLLLILESEETAIESNLKTHSVPDIRFKLIDGFEEEELYVFAFLRLIFIQPVCNSTLTRALTSLSVSQAAKLSEFVITWMHFIQDTDTRVFQASLDELKSRAPATVSNDTAYNKCIVSVMNCLIDSNLTSFLLSDELQVKILALAVRTRAEVEFCKEARALANILGEIKNHKVRQVGSSGYAKRINKTIGSYAIEYFEWH